VSKFRRLNVLVFVGMLTVACMGPVVVPVVLGQRGTVEEVATKPAAEVTTTVRVSDPGIAATTNNIRDLTTLVTVVMTGLTAISAGFIVGWRKLRTAWHEHEAETKLAAEKVASQAVSAAEKVARTTRAEMTRVKDQVVQEASPAVNEIVAMHTEQLRQQIARIEASNHQAELSTQEAEIARKKMIDAIWDLNKKVDFISQTMMHVLTDAATRKEK
jgi:hypothetical protein